jgi:sensor domain DACNV-containing protein
MQSFDPTIPVPVYAAAHAVAARAHEHFLRHREEARAQGGAAVLVPDSRDIEVMVDTAFWACMRREEGYVPTISLAFLPPDRGVRPLLFERPLPLNPAALARLGPAVERPGIQLGIWRSPDGLHAWGLTTAIPEGAPGNTSGTIVCRLHVATGPEDRTRPSVSDLWCQMLRLVAVEETVGTVA